MPNDRQRDRNPGHDAKVPTEDTQREAQDRAKGATGRGKARSPVDSMHVDAPKKQDNTRGHMNGEIRKE